MGDDAVSGAPALRLRGVSKRFGGVRALEAVDFDLAAGEVHCLAGENGSGKSTLIKIVTGVHAPDPGAAIEVFGQPIDAMTPGLARRMGIDVIWQDLALFPQMSVAENIGFEAMLGGGLRLARRGALRERARAALDRLGVSLDLRAPLGALSVAGRQIVAVARALVRDARIVFMDEPTASLTQAETGHLLDVVRKLSADGVSVVFVSHRLAEVLEISARVTVLRDGRRVGVYAAGGMTPSRLAELMTGRTFDSAVTARDMSAAPPVLEVRGLTRRGEYRNVDLTVRAGEVVGLTGLMGAGRTELAHTLFGMTRAEAGEMRLHGAPVAFRSNRDAIAAGVAYVPEDRLTLGLVQAQSIADNVVVASLGRISDAAGLIPARRKSDLTARWLGALSVKTGAQDHPVSTLSGGNQQRVVLAKWLATEPTLLILDAPTVGVDVGARAGIFAIVRGLAANGLAILLISDETSEVYFNADRVLHMEAGRIVGAFRPGRASLRDIEVAVYG
jgi:simple sugar transport system ATP-binding protein